MIKFLFIGGPELIIVAVLILLLFGGRKIPELMKGIGKGIRGFKNEVQEDKKTDKKPESTPKLDEK